MVMSFQIFMFWLQRSISPFLEERRYGRIFLFLLLLFIYLFIYSFFAEHSIGLVLLWMSELSLALACAVGYFELRPFLSLVGESDKHDALIKDILHITFSKSLTVHEAITKVITTIAYHDGG